MTTTRRKLLFKALAVAFFLVPAGFGFMYKYFDLLILASHGEEGAFALIPIANYLFSSLGFFMLFFWAVKHGMFDQVEKVKYTMLDTEKQLDQQEEDEKETATWR